MDLSCLLWSFTKLAYCPTALLAAIEVGLPHSLAPFQGDAECCAKLVWSMATFGQMYPATYGVVMAALSHQDTSQLSLSQMHQLVTSHLLSVRDGCARGGEWLGVDTCTEGTGRCRCAYS